MKSTILSLIVLVTILGLTNGRNSPAPKEEVKRSSNDDINHSEPTFLEVQQQLEPAEINLNRKLEETKLFKKGGHHHGGHKKESHSNVEHAHHEHHEIKIKPILKH